MDDTTLIQAAKNTPRKFMLLESTQIPLSEVPVDQIPNKERALANMINPITGKPYEDGIILTGIFADLNPELNRNNRIYSIPEYVELIDVLYQQIFSKRGLFGEFEHPEKYGTDGKKVSHKILDIFYDPTKKLVFGTVLVLDTPNGKIVKEIIKSGGLVCISGRAAGSEVKQADGTLLATTKLLITYDLVMNPGFTTAELNYAGKSDKGFSVMLYESQMKHFNASYSKYISLNENMIEGCFIEWYAKHHKLNESDNDDLTADEEDSFQELEIPKQTQQQNKLQKVTDSELKQAFLDEANGTLTGYYHQQIKRKGAGAVYDDSAGFLSADPDGSVIIPAGNCFQSFLDSCAEETEFLLNQEEQDKQKNQEPQKQKKQESSKQAPQQKKQEPQKKQTKGLSGSDYLNKQSPKQSPKQVQEPKAQQKPDTEVKPQKPDTEVKPKKKSLGTKVKQVGAKAKDIGKKNARYYLNLDMDDGNSNAGKAIIEK